MFQLQVFTNAYSLQSSFSFGYLEVFFLLVSLFEKTPVTSDISRSTYFYALWRNRIQVFQLFLTSFEMQLVKNNTASQTPQNINNPY